MEPRCELMPDGSLVLHLEEHCLETTARRAREALAGAYLEGRREGPEVEAVIALLGAFLGELDFRAIRAAHPGLAGGHSARLRVWRPPGGRVEWETLV
jgi:hypothetical protein